MSNLNLFQITNTQNKKYKFLINKRFKTCSEVTQRTIEVADAFGLGIDDEQEFIIFDNFSVGFDDGNVIYITGDSGSGKSLLLKSIMENLKEEDYIHEKLIDINPEETLIEGIGKDMNEALKILSIVGLNDAFLYLRKYKQLSDGQKLRYKLAKMINSGKEIFIFDEFCATLDRETAKIISFNIQKYVRKNKKILIVATTHTDLKEDLSPNVYIYKKFNNDISTEYNDKINQKCSILNGSNLEIKQLDSLKKIEDLEKFHYRGEASIYKSIWGLYLNKELIGCMVIGYPMINLKGRNIYTNNKYSKTTSENLKIINNEFEVISRVIIHPKYRGIGLSYYLINKYIMELTKSKYIETIAVMAKYNPFFEKAGLKRIETNKDEKYEQMLLKIISLGFNKDKLRSWKYIKEIYNTLNEEKKDIFNNIFKTFFNGYQATHGGDKNIDKLNDKEDEYFKIFKKMIRTDIQYLIYDNSEKYDKLNKQIQTKLF